MKNFLKPSSTMPLRIIVLEEAHGNTFAGPPGVTSSLKKIISSGLFWPTLIDDVVHHVQHCNACQKNCPSPSQSTNASGALWSFKPFESLHVDTMGPYDPDENGFTCVYVFVDAFTRYTVLVPAVANTALDCAKALLSHVLPIFGVPKSIRSDLGSEFCNHAMKWLYDPLKIEHVTSYPYHHESNDLVERRNREVLTLLRKLLVDTRKYSDWSVLLPHVQLILNSTASTVTEHSPHSLLFGTNLSPRRDLLDTLRNVDLPRPLRTANDSLAYLQELTLRIKAKVELAQNIQDKRMSKIPEQSNVPKFKVNDLVLRVSPRRLSKLHGHEGSFLVTSVLGSNGYRITCFQSILILLRKIN
ncbi:hypothetical protein RCL1_009014 [Eukaryota sp. TZLM3-RCL]